MTPAAYKVAYDKLFTSLKWDEAQEKCMMMAGREVRDEILEKNPKLKIEFEIYNFFSINYLVYVL